MHTALARGRQRDHELVCSTCGTTLAWGHRPAPLAHPAPLLRCPRYRSLDDPTVEPSGVS